MDVAVGITEPILFEGKYHVSKLDLVASTACLCGRYSDEKYACADG